MLTVSRQSFVFHKTTGLFDRRSRFVHGHVLPARLICALWMLTSHSKLVSTIVSTFTACYVYSWSTFFPDSPLVAPLPSFDGRAVCYPSVQNLRELHELETGRL